MSHRLIALMGVILLTAPGSAEAMAEYSGWVHTTSGRAVPRARVTVLAASTGGLATIYSDNGVTLKANPFTADPLNGDYSFRAENGSYSIVFSQAGEAFDVADMRQVVLYDPATGTLDTYTRGALPAPSKAGRLVRVADQDGAIYVDDGKAWRPLGDYVHRLRAVDATGPHAIGGNAVAGSFLDVTGSMTSPGTANAMRIRSTVAPMTGGVGGDGYGLFLNPSFVVGAAGTHKRLATLRVDYPGASLTPGTGNIQETDAIYIGATAAFPEPPLGGPATQGNYAIRIAGGYPSRFTGALQLDAAGGPSKNIRIGAVSHAIALDLRGVWFAPDAGRVGWVSRMQGTFNTAASGAHTDLGGLEVVTPTVTTAGGARVNNFTTLKVGDAPAAVGNAVPRALWVGKGASQIEGDLALGGSLAIGTSVVLRVGTKRDDPPAPAANEVRLYARDAGGGAPQLCAQFARGAVQCFATAPSR